MARSRRSLLALAASLLFARELPALDSVLGVAELEGDALCLVSTASGLAPGAAVTLVDPRPPQRFFTAAVGAPRPAGCRFAEGAALPGATYAIDAEGITEASPLVAVAVSRGALELVGGAVHAELDAEPPSETFRLCTGSEGMWITVWSGEPLAGRLRWQVYYYLGYDVDPTCEEADGADPSP